MKSQLALGLKEAADAVGLSHWTLRQYVKQGKIHAIKLGRRVLIEPEELQRLIEQGRGGKQVSSIQCVERKTI
jgi:excisionase family DNA binding protein